MKTYNLLGIVKRSQLVRHIGPAGLRLTFSSLVRKNPPASNLVISKCYTLTEINPHVYILDMQTKLNPRTEKAKLIALLMTPGTRS